MPQRHDYRIADISARLLADRRLHLDICSALESMADGLPALQSFALVRSLLDIIVPSANEHAAFQEQVVFPILMRHHDGNGDIVTQIATLESQHGGLTDLSHEIAEQLRLILAGDEPDTAMLGYMFRNAFHGWRQHLETEELLFKQALPVTLAPVDRVRIEAWLREHPLPAFALQGRAARPH